MRYHKSYVLTIRVLRVRNSEYSLKGALLLFCRKIIFICILLLAGGSVGAYATDHPISFVPSSSSFAILTTSCHLTGHFRPLTPGQSSVVAGSSGTILFDCDGDPAFLVMNPGVATPYFSLPQGYTGLTIVAHVAGSSSCRLGSVLVPNHSVDFTKRNSFDYCAAYSSPPGSTLASFTLTWTRMP